jgi:hypothetical protein
MEENSDLSDSDSDLGDNSEEGKDPTERQDADNEKSKRRGKKKDGGRDRTRSSKDWYRIYESPPSTIAIMIVACWILRIPCLYHDFARYGFDLFHTAYRSLRTTSFGLGLSNRMNYRTWIPSGCFLRAWYST